jgi:hypothetical protein
MSFIMPFWKRKKKSQTPPIIVCPKCLKPTLKDATNVSGFISNKQYYCTSCHYTGVLYLEVDPNETGENLVNLEKLKKDYPEDVESVDTPEKEASMPEEKDKQN